MLFVKMKMPFLCHTSNDLRLLIKYIVNSEKFKRRITLLLNTVKGKKVRRFPEILIKKMEVFKIILLLGFNHSFYRRRIFIRGNFWLIFHLQCKASYTLKCQITQDRGYFMRVLLPFYVPIRVNLQILFIATLWGFKMNKLKSRKQWSYDGKLAIGQHAGHMFYYQLVS